LGSEVEEKKTLMVFENRVLRSIFGPKRDDVTGGWRSCIMRSYIIYTPPKLLG
jgi:hypothetical protein